MSHQQATKRVTRGSRVGPSALGLSIWAALQLHGCASSDAPDDMGTPPNAVEVRHGSIGTEVSSASSSTGGGITILRGRIESVSPTCLGAICIEGGWIP